MVIMLSQIITDYTILLISFDTFSVIRLFDVSLYEAVILDYLISAIT